MWQNAQLSFAYKPQIVISKTEEEGGPARGRKPNNGTAVLVLSEKGYSDTVKGLEGMVNG